MYETDTSGTTEGESSQDEGQAKKKKKDKKKNKKGKGMYIHEKADVNPVTFSSQQVNQ